MNARKIKGIYSSQCMPTLSRLIPLSRKRNKRLLVEVASRLNSCVKFRIACFRTHDYTHAYVRIAAKQVRHVSNTRLLATVKFQRIALAYFNKFSFTQGRPDTEFNQGGLLILPKKSELRQCLATYFRLLPSNNRMSRVPMHRFKAYKEM